MEFLTDFILLSCIKAMEISAWSKINSTAFSPALHWSLSDQYYAWGAKENAV
jgi:hypothetical protein